MWKRLFPNMAKMEAENLLTLPIVLFMGFALALGLAKKLATTFIYWYFG